MMYMCQCCQDDNCDLLELWRLWCYVKLVELPEKVKKIVSELGGPYKGEVPPNANNSDPMSSTLYSLSIIIIYPLNFINLIHYLTDTFFLVISWTLFHFYINMLQRL
jgi:hypothetical protein